MRAGLHAGVIFLGLGACSWLQGTTPQGGEDLFQEVEDLDPATEATLMEACKPHADLLEAERGMEVADKVGKAVKSMPLAEATALCRSLAGKPKEQVFAALEGLAAPAD